MLDLAFTEKTFTVSRNGKSVLSFALGQQLAVAAKGKAAFSMSRGSFTHKDRQTERTPLFLTSCAPDGSLLTLSYKSGQEALHLHFSVCGDILKIDTRLHPGISFNRFTFRLPAEPTEQFYGCGEQFHRFPLRGDKIRIWVAEHQNSKRITKKIFLEKLRGRRPNRVGPSLSYESYYVQPTVVSSQCRFLHSDTSEHVMFDFRAPDFIEAEFRGFAPFYLGYADDFPALSELLSVLLDVSSPCPTGQTTASSPEFRVARQQWSAR